MSTQDCPHQWRPLIRAELVHGVPQTPYGSFGSQIGYHCPLCDATQILWPDMAANAGVSEDALVRGNCAVMEGGDE